MASDRSTPARDGPVVRPDGVVAWKLLARLERDHVGRAALRLAKLEPERLLIDASDTTSYEPEAMTALSLALDDAHAAVAAPGKTFQCVVFAPQGSPVLGGLSVLAMKTHASLHVVYGAPVAESVLCRLAQAHLKANKTARRPGSSSTMPAVVPPNQKTTPPTGSKGSS